MTCRTIEAQLPNFSVDIESVSQRALTKPVDQVISISGNSGANGYSGADGTSGFSGCDGGIGGCGTRGGDGSGGLDGQSGHPGTNAQHALIWLNGTVDYLNMQVQTFQTLNNPYNYSPGIDWNLAQSLSNINYSFQLDKSNGIILVKAVGGNGGDGGRGGVGGGGGCGGDGGRGDDGTDGYNSYDEGASGGCGGSGGNGGNGGCGGNGGNGGRGGDGGDAGAGGHIQVRSADPRLFMLIEPDCRAGEKGRGGHGRSGGSGGIGGAGGSGGRGGRGGHGGPGGASGSDGMSGSSGSCGMSGYAGSDGSHGRDGRPASHGSIQYAVIDISGNILETGPDKYHASVGGYTITDENNDGIYEPDSNFFITSVKWANNGALTMPSGCILSFPSTKYITNDAEDVSVLPGIHINQVLVDSHQFKCHLDGPHSLSINRPYKQPVKITSEIRLLNRLFSGSQVSASFSCQYPIQITKIDIPTFLGPNERATVTVSFTNISGRSYGACSDSAGSIECIFSTHSLLKILPANGEYFYEIKSDGYGYYKINEEIASRKTKHIKFEMILEGDAVHQYYEHLFWNIDLLLRDKLIEKHSNNIRVVPTFQPNIRTDVLLVTNSQVGRAEFLAYQNLFQLFQYSSQTWDIERYGAFHNPEIKWLNTTDLIIFIYSNPESTFNTIKSRLFLEHMKSSENAGFICIGAGLPDDFDFALFDYYNLQFIDIKQKTKSEATNHLWSGFGFSRPSNQQLIVKANTFRTDYEKQDDHRFLYQVVYDDTANADAAGCMTVVYGAKYVYKSTLDSQVGNRVIMTPSNNPLLTSSKLPSILQGQQSNVNSSQDIIQKEIDLNSQFGRLLCAILFYQGFEKSHMIISERRELANYIFTTGSRILNFNQILTSLAMSIIEREYDRQALEFQSSQRLVNQIAIVIKKENNQVDARVIHKNDWFYLLIQSLYEYIDSKFWSSFPWCGCTTKAKQRHKLQQILDDLLALTSNDIPKNKEIQREVQILRLQKLANLKFPAADKREICARPIEEIRAWQLEQKIEGITSTSAVALEKY
ncbi:unnamed protein product [Rotaria sp. Silwood1]|nr:unnamed protein product [Rotaria sp. Silwood1]CAF5003211.1 unnamed protein product [Rotaria sp. Silwood1]